MPIARLALALALLTVSLFVAMAPTPVRAQASVSLSAPFDPGRLTRAELRIVQAALAHAGTYDALLDGAWGAGSRAALAAYAARQGGGTPNWRDLRGLLRRWESERRGAGWTGIWHSGERVWHLRPDAILERSDRNGEERWFTEDGGLVVIARRSERRPDAVHLDVIADARSGTSPYRTQRDDRIITAARLRSGRQIYVRSDREGGVWLTHVIVADAANEMRLQLIASSFSRARRGDLAPAPDGLVARLIADITPLPDPVAPPPAAPGGGETLEDALRGALAGALIDLLNRDEDEDARDVPAAAPDPGPPARPSPEATGVFVNTTDIVTTARMERTCDAVETRGGERLRLLASADGIAVYARRGRMSDWIALAAETPGRGTEIEALAREPGTGRFSVARGRVLRDLAEEGLLLVDPVEGRDLGPSGTVLVTGDGRLIGILGPPAGDGLADAVSAGGVAAVLDGARIPFATRAPDGGRGIEERVRRAVVALRCQER